MLGIRSKATEVHMKSRYGEHVWCQIGELTTGVIYRSNYSQIVGQDNNNNLLKLLREVCHKQVLILEDFNYSDVDWITYTALSSASHECCEFINTVEDCFLTQHVLCPTRGDAILDLVFTKEPELVSNLKVINNLGDSDHHIILFTIHLLCNDHDDIKKLRDYRKGDFVRINQCLSDMDWDDYLSSNNEVSWNRFRDLLLDLVNRYIPMKTITQKSKFKKPIWMTHKAVNFVGKKRKAFRKYRDISHPAVKSANRAAKKELRRSLKNFESKLAQNIKSDRKSFFAYIRGKTKSKVLTGPLSDSGGNIIDSPDEMVEEFNSYFASVFTSENLHQLPTAVNMFCGSADDRCQDVIFSEADIAEALSRLREDKAAGPDDLSPRLLLWIKDQISYPLFLLFRKSLDEGIVPADWKLSNVSPIFKKGSRTLAENYRLVSLTSVICKLFESIMSDTISAFL